MSLFIATGTNLGDRKGNLEEATKLLSERLTLIAQSRIYESAAVDYLDQPDFYNQVLEFEIPNESPESIMDFLLETEKVMGRNRTVPKGPRVIDLDMLFWGDLTIKSKKLTLPHPRLFFRSFVVSPLSELPGFQTLMQTYHFPKPLDGNATPISD